MAACTRLRSDPRDLSDGRSTAAVSAARASVAHAARDGAGHPGEAVAELVGATGVAVPLARRRGRRRLAAHRWSADEVPPWQAVAS